jgi:hypothetical protein
MHQHAHTVTVEMERCITNCLDCHRVCQETAAYCLEMGGMHAEAAHQRLMRDCIQICITSADFMLRGSDLHARVCGVCAEVCRRCADDCARFGNDEQMRKCEQACRRCAESCEEMARA